MAAVIFTTTLDESTETHKVDEATTKSGREGTGRNAAGPGPVPEQQAGPRARPITDPLMELIIALWPVAPAGPVAQVEVQLPPWVELAPRNAARVLDVLGLTGPARRRWPHGQCDAADFLGRVLLARALTPPGGGYLDDRLGQLEALAEWAVLHGRPVVWA